ncbi:MAG TPA: plastocyanin/azurin family copper-binding protein [Gammaproteobacteria bacterium]|nr:plastocyanin/azurin family copper-binding protein [Gammaproteobacteria bacterium]
MIEHESNLLRLSRRAFVAAAVLVPLAAYAEPPPVDLYVESDGDFLAFKPTELTCYTGAHVTLTFHHAGRRIQQKHDWVLLQPGTADAFIEAVLAAGEKNNWMPPGDPRVLASTPQILPGESATIEFTAPPPGDYPFVCTFAGHGAVMRGVLHVLVQ